jgi:hypothetical protein
MAATSANWRRSPGIAIAEHRHGFAERKIGVGRPRRRRALVVGNRAITGSAASASQMGRFETKWLSRPENLTAPADLPGQWIGNVHQGRPPKTIVLDMDSSGSREPDLWSAGRQCLQRAFRLHLL